MPCRATVKRLWPPASPAISANPCRCLFFAPSWRAYCLKIDGPMKPTNTTPSVSLVIIDDNAGSLDLLSSALAQEGLDIFVASDPEAGLDLVYDKHPQIVLTDLVMPGMSGMEVLERIMEFDPTT